MKNIAILLVTTIVFISCRATLIKKTEEESFFMPAPIYYVAENQPKTIKKDTIYLPKKIAQGKLSNALSKIDKITSDLEVKDKLEHGYFRVVDSLRTSRARVKGKDSTILVLKKFIQDQGLRDKKQDAINTKILNGQDKGLLLAAENKLFNKSLDIELYAGFAVVILIVLVQGIILYYYKRS